MNAINSPGRNAEKHVETDIIIQWKFHMKAAKVSSTKEHHDLQIESCRSSNPLQGLQQQLH